MSRFKYYIALLITMSNNNDNQSIRTTAYLGVTRYGKRTTVKTAFSTLGKENPYFIKDVAKIRDTVRRLAKDKDVVKMYFYTFYADYLKTTFYNVVFETVNTTDDQMKYVNNVLIEREF